ncbi:MAG TPA: thioredoxin domain-containing protein, partial [Candidatus Baltobacteraceae bacterium]|nr:thioredoxin domain-containing protein [Candidatus Baltobacteraceae bacterium]
MTENRLKNSASPYLRSAAHQPIDWHEWGEDAFAKARAANKPVLLDIGAVWCHWCHVIDRESYENPEIAAIINELYIPVKVDRDERPDVDARYQSAISAISGQGGWPLTAFLTPDGKPFFGGTYFPPEDAMGRPGFKRILAAIADAFEKRRADVDQSAHALEQAVSKAEIFQGAHGKFDARVVDTVVDAAVKRFDARHGGFGDAPKFPHSSAIDLLLERQKWPGGDELRTIVEKTLDGMAAGGFADQIGGGFHRYSVDERWCVPHFEKMSYDNSELLRNYLHGYQSFGLPHYKHVAEDLIAWVGEVLSDPARGGFYASQDADQTLDDDGDYFTWTQQEARAVLAPEEFRAVERYYEIGPLGEMHHNSQKNVLWIAESVEEVARELHMPEDQVALLIARAKGKMIAARRERRPTPAIDDTIYVAWNAMFVSAYLEAARVLERPDCREFALKTLDRIIAEAWDESKGFAHRVGGPRLEGSLDDQVFTIAALLDAWEVTLDRRYFEIAQKAMRIAVERFGDPDGGGFFDRAKDAAPMGGLEVRRKPLQDSPTPGGNSVGAIVLDRLHALTGERPYHEWARKTLEAFAGLVPQYGLFAATYALAALLHARHPLQVVITGAADDAKADALEAAAHGVYRFGKVVLRVTPERLAGGALPAALRETIPHLDASVPQAFVCVETTCFPPVSDPGKLAALLAEAATGSRAA